MGVGAAGAAAIVGTVATVASTAISMASASSAADAQSANSNYQAQVAANNSKIAEQNAQYATRAGEVQATNASMKNAAQVGAIRAAAAANNVDVNSGSESDVQASQRETGELNTLTTMNNAMLTAYGYRTQGVNYKAQSQLDTQEADQAQTAGDFAIAGDLASGASSIAGKWGGGGGGSGIPDFVDQTGGTVGFGGTLG